DPLSGQNRNWTGVYPAWEWNFELRRDLAKWSYGATLSDRADFTFFRTDEVDSMLIERVYGRAFAEFRPEKRTTLRLDVENLLDTAGQRYREFFAPDRSAPDPVVTEFRQRNSHLQFTFSINRTFGAA
ncbi:MAG TPA: hypothetical protein VK839_01605, partial [Erythrobacter sp.]|nr:hypothetical protein [Erythrobacter sp.]